MNNLNGELMKKLLLAALMTISTFASASEFPNLVEGKDYTKSKTADVLVESKDKPVVVEMFWYGCGHCYAILPLSKELFKKHENKIVPAHYPVGFDGWASGVKLFFTLEQMNLLSTMHEKVFHAIHKEGKNLLKKDRDREEFLKANNVDPKKFNDIYNSFAISTKVTKAKNVTTNLKIESSPAYAVYYKGYTYQTSPALTNSYQKTISVLDTIITEQTKTQTPPKAK